MMLWCRHCSAWALHFYNKFWAMTCDRCGTGQLKPVSPAPAGEP